MSRETVLSSMGRIGDIVNDPEEETFILFSQDLPSRDLGMLDAHAPEVDIELAGQDYTLRQSESLLRSTRESGTTGAMLWQVTSLVASWLTTQTSPLWAENVLSSEANIVELGCGVGGLNALALSPLVGTYVLTDQRYVTKLLKDNILANAARLQKGEKTRRTTASGEMTKNACWICGNIGFLAYDWEQDSALNLRTLIPGNNPIDLVVVCDCIYNSHLILPLIQACIEVCRLSEDQATVVLIAQQLRADTIFEEWLTALSRSFLVWRVKDELLPKELQNGSGFIVHLAILQPSSK